MPAPTSKLFQLFADLLSRIQNGAPASLHTCGTLRAASPNLQIGCVLPFFVELCAGIVRVSHISRLHQLL